MGRAGNNPMCHHRALDFDSRDLRERLVKVQDGGGRSFDYGEFKIVVSPLPLRLCRGCRHFIRIENETCDFCGADLVAREAAHAADVAAMQAAIATLRDAMAARHDD